MGILQGGGNSLLVGQLLVDGMLGRMRSGCYLDGDFESRGQRSQELHANRQSDQGGHAAVRNRWSETDVDVVGFVVDGDQWLLDDVKLFERQWVFRVVDDTNQICVAIGNYNFTVRICINI